MQKTRSLVDLKRGETGCIDSIQDDDLAERLMEMNLIPGKNLQILYRAPFGDPIAIDVEGYTLSLRLDEARLILLT